MFVVTGTEMALIDKMAINEWGIPELILMENAGLKVVEEIKERFQQLIGKKVIVVAGRGNNGGDGLVIARHLSNLGADVKVFMLGTKEYKGAALVNYKIAQKLPIKWQLLENENSLHLLKLSLHYTDIVVDALFGTGFKGIVQGLAAKVIEIINESNSFILSVDIPSGLDADTGKVFGPCIKADTTVTFALPKLGLVIQPGCNFAGQLKIVDISIPSDLINKLDIDKNLITKNEVEKSLPRRKEDSHKGSYGHLLIVGGSLGMMGAVHLAASGGFALGAGLVTAVVPRSIQPSLASSFPELITQPVSETPQGTFGFISGPEIIKYLPRKTALVFGPGVGKHNELQPLLKWLIDQLEIPVVIDADGLNVLAEDLGILSAAKAPVILTPHPGEMSRLLNMSPKEIQDARLEATRSLAVKYRVWVVLKGYKTVIATPKGNLFINTSGSPALATAGTGDVLTGMIGAMIGQIGDITRAICASVYLHGLAGQFVSQEIGEISSKASHVVEAVPKILKKEFSL